MSQKFRPGVMGLLMLVVFLAGPSAESTLHLKPVCEQLLKHPDLLGIWNVLGKPSRSLVHEDSANSGIDIAKDEMVFRCDTPIVIGSIERYAQGWVTYLPAQCKVRSITLTLTTTREAGAAKSDVLSELGKPSETFRVSESEDVDLIPDMKNCMRPDGTIEIWRYRSGLEVWFDTETKKAWLVEVYPDVREMPKYERCK